MLDIRKLKELVRLMVNNDLTELDLRDSEEQVTLRRHGPGHAPQVVAGPAVTAPPAPAPPGAAAGAAGATAVAEAPDRGQVSIDSPMVGTFYASPNPDSPPFVSVGSIVDPETVVCLVEAMKIFNEIKAECAGTIERVLVSNGESVEFGQPMFLVRPA
jgi:acetyl-CoA carboxylase biotin carboxyl carrier protein